LKRRPRIEGRVYRSPRSSCCVTILLSAQPGSDHRRGHARGPGRLCLAIGIKPPPFWRAVQHPVCGAGPMSRPREARFVQADSGGGIAAFEPLASWSLMKLRAMHDIE